MSIRKACIKTNYTGTYLKNYSVMAHMCEVAHYLQEIWGFWSSEMLCCVLGLNDHDLKKYHLSFDNDVTHTCRQDMMPVDFSGRYPTRKISVSLAMTTPAVWGELEHKLVYITVHAAVPATYRVLISLRFPKHTYRTSKCYWNSWCIRMNV